MTIINEQIKINENNDKEPNLVEIFHLEEISGIILSVIIFSYWSLFINSSTGTSSPTPTYEKHPENIYFRGVQALAECELCLSFSITTTHKLYNLPLNKKMACIRKKILIQFSIVQSLCFCVQIYLFFFMAIVRGCFLTAPCNYSCFTNSSLNCRHMQVIPILLQFMREVYS